MGGSTTIRPSKTAPALLGGLFLGVLSALPIVSAGNFCCCLWVISGGVLAAYLMEQNAPGQTRAGDGATVGLLAGVFGSIVYVGLSIPIALMLGPLQRRWVERMLERAQDIPPEMRDMFGTAAPWGVLGVLMTLTFVVCILAFATAGGLLGWVIFRKQTPPPPPVIDVPTPIAD